MKILVVDDQTEKTGAVIRLLSGECGIARDDIEAAVSVIDAKRLLSRTDYDLLILDVLLPVRVEDEPKIQSSMELLKDIESSSKIRKPKQIIALTAYSETKDKLDELLREKVWGIFHYDPTSCEWLNAIKNCVAYYAEQGRQQPLLQYQTDLCILTALQDPEETAVLNLPWNWCPPSPVDDTLFARQGSFEDTHGDKCSVILAHAPRMGMVATAISALKLIEKFRPRFIVMVGICAGYKGKVNLGDVVLADPSWDYQSGKRSRESEISSFEPDPHHLGVPGFIRSRFVELQRDRSVIGEVKLRWQGDAPDTELKILSGPMASGSVVVDDQIVMDDVKSQQRKLLALEMEAYGLYAAAAEAPSPKPTAFAIKSVCDFGNGGKNDNYQKYAAYTSAQTLKLFFEKFYADIRELSGTS